MDLFETGLAMLPVLPDVVTNVVGGAAIIATVFARPESQWASKIYRVINILGFNFGEAKNKGDK